ncbi:MAG TPA: rhodanese-like domain-containing protein [Candidatus Thermoplasmatota archaeon]|nr:rhodanese-like domain-containing protein [Candidatus Thermoplasmatota archaeon]
MRVPAALALLLALPLLAGCASSPPPDDAAITTLDVHAWKQRLDTTAKAFVLDVRTPAEYEAGHIAEATNIPHDAIRARAGDLPADKATPMFVYCRTGARSAAASETLADLGYTHIVNMVGGYPDWAAAGYPTA